MGNFAGNLLSTRGARKYAKYASLLENHLVPRRKNLLDSPRIDQPTSREIFKRSSSLISDVNSEH